MCCGLKIFRKNAQYFLLYKMYRGDLIFSLFLRFNYSKSDHSKIYKFFFWLKIDQNIDQKFFFGWFQFPISLCLYWASGWFIGGSIQYQVPKNILRQISGISEKKKFSRFFGSWPIYWALGWPIAWLAYRWSDPPPRPKKFFASKSCFWVISSISEKKIFFDFLGHDHSIGPYSTIGPYRPNRAIFTPLWPYLSLQ